MRSLIDLLWLSGSDTVCRAAIYPARRDSEVARRLGASGDHKALGTLPWFEAVTLSPRFMKSFGSMLAFSTDVNRVLAERPLLATSDLSRSSPP